MISWNVVGRSTKAGGTGSLRLTNYKYDTFNKMSGLDNESTGRYSHASSEGLLLQGLN